MIRYKGSYICPFCEEKFKWEYIDFRFCDDVNELLSEPSVIEPNTTIARCVLYSPKSDGVKVLTGYCTHCQSLVEIKDINGVIV